MYHDDPFSSGRHLYSDETTLRKGYNYIESLHGIDNEREGQKNFNSCDRLSYDPNDTSDEDEKEDMDNVDYVTRRMDLTKKQTRLIFLKKKKVYMDGMYIFILIHYFHFFHPNCLITYFSLLSFIFPLRFECMFF